MKDTAIWYWYWDCQKNPSSLSGPTIMVNIRSVIYEQDSILIEWNSFVLVIFSVDTWNAAFSFGLSTTLVLLHRPTVFHKQDVQIVGEMPPPRHIPKKKSKSTSSAGDTEYCWIIYSERHARTAKFFIVEKKFSEFFFFSNFPIF